MSSALRPRLANGLLTAAALAGAVVSWIAMSHWTPEAAVSFPDREAAIERAYSDAEALGYRIAGQPRLELSAGSRAFTSLADIQVLLENQPNAKLRRRLLAAAPPIRLGVRFFDAVGMEGVPDTLLLEYDGRAELVGAAFAGDRFLGVRPVARTASPEFADRVAELLLGKPPPEPLEVRMLETVERIYSPGGPEPAAYVSLSASTRWLAHLQPIGAPLLTYTAKRFGSPGEQLRFYILIGIGILALAVLLWRLTNRRAGFGRAPALAALLLTGILPSLDLLTEPNLPVLLWLYFLLCQAGVLLIWTAGEAELREVRPEAIEHFDRLLTRRPVRATGAELLFGFAAGCVLSGLRTAGGEIASLFGGGYSSVLAILPDQWALSSPLSQGLGLASVTIILVGFGGRLGGRSGAIAGVTLTAAPWSMALWVAPLGWALGLGLAAALAAGWVLWHRGLLALAVCTVTALSLPTAGIGWAAFPLQPLIALVASLPLAAPVAGALLLWRAPRSGGEESIAPSWVSDLQTAARLDAEIDLLRSMQLSLLPPQPLIASAGADIAWEMIPADTVGGDFLEVAEDSAGRLWIAVADVAGHGIACSTLTAYTKAAVVEHAVAGATPATALPKIRDLFARLRPADPTEGRSERATTPRPRTMVTLLLALWDPPNRELRVATAGHLPLLLAHADGCGELGKPGQPLGVELRGEISEQIFSCHGPALLVAYSDGVVEATSPNGEAYGYERWPELLPSLASGCAQQVLTDLLADVDAHRAGNPADDDVTVIVVKLPAGETI